MDRIRKLPLDEKSAHGILQLLRVGVAKPQSRLKPKQRSLILDFERQLVELHLLDDPQANQLAAACIQAILSDRSFFYGLKPLAQHTDEFAYELLYPTWLNLYTAMRTRSGDGAPKFDDEQVREVINCVRELEPELQDSCQPLVGLLTFVANRFTAAETLKLSRRLTRLFSAEQAPVETYVARIDALLQRSPTAGVLRELFPAYLAVECCLQGEPDERSENASRGPFPQKLAQTLWELQQAPDADAAFQNLLLAVAKIVERAGGFDKNLGRLFSTGRYETAQLVDLCLSDDAGQPAFSCQVQKLIARLLELESPSDPQSRAVVRRLAGQFGRRLDALDPKDLRVFAGEFIEKDGNREVLLAVAHDSELRQRVADQLLKATRQESNADRFFYRLQAAAVIGSWQDVEGLERIRRSIKVLKVSLRDESISPRELTELTDDLRQNLPESLSYLESPGFAGRGKSDRIAKIYLALNEACQLYADTGKVPNFGLVRAGFRILDQLADE